MKDLPAPAHNLYTALRPHTPRTQPLPAPDAADPASGRGLDAVVAIETAAGLTYLTSDLDRGAAMIANLFAALGLPEGSRVLAQVDKSVEAVMLYLATLRAGFVYVPLNPAYQRAEVEFYLADADAAIVVCAPAHFGWISPLAFRTGTRVVYTLGTGRDGSLLERAAVHSDHHAVAAVRPTDPAAIVYTSGTTGRSKGAVLSHANLRANAQVLKTAWHWQPGDVLIHALPIFHVHGLFVALHGALLNGSRMLWLDAFDAATVVRLLPRATVFMGVPTLYVRLLDEPGLTRDACAAMRLFVSGSAPLLVDTFERFHDRTGHTLLERYGMSETLMLTSNPYRPETDRRPGTVGRPLPGVSVRLVGEDGRMCAVGEIGAVQVRGPSVFEGYWRLPEKNLEDFAVDATGPSAGARWFRTGDVGRFDENGVLTLVGRSKDVVITGGFNVYPAEVEGHLDALPGVGESAVFGVPHPDYGEAVCAAVVPRPGETPDAQDLITTLKRRIAGFKVPKRVILLAELPRNAMGKVQKARLREAHAGLFAV